MAYLLDSNVFIQAKNLHYGFDFCPAFWEWLIEQNAIGEIFSIKKVREEILAVEDELSIWVQSLNDDFFLEPDSNVLPVFSEISHWVNSKEYNSSAISDFLNVADYYLVAQAKAGNHVVVTHEGRSNSRKRVKIPDVCIGLDVPCINPYEMLRTHKARFVLGKSGI